MKDTSAKDDSEDDLLKKLHSQNRTVLFHEYGTQLRVLSDDTMILNVLCGRIMQYGVEFPLSDHERQQYKLQGDDYLRTLAARVLNSPDTYALRGRKC
ncbi:MAG: hypothetical protein ACK5O8_08300 [Pirellula sp.]|jgi:hypothetical protein